MLIIYKDFSPQIHSLLRLVRVPPGGDTSSFVLNRSSDVRFFIVK
jgi:hypothetical protein